MTVATKTANTYAPGKGSIEIQITSAMDTAVAAIAAGDVGTWVHISNILVSRTSPARERTQSEEFVTGDTSPIVSVAENIGGQVHTIVLMDTDGTAEDYGLAGSINVHDDILHPCFLNNLAIPWRYTDKGKTTGNKLYTYTSTDNDPRVTTVGNPEIEAGSNARAKRTYTIVTTGAPTEGTVA